MIRRAFTLIEILVAVMLTGLLSSLALAPVVLTVRNVVDTQEQYADISALSRTMSFIGRDLFSAMRIAPTVLVIKDHEALGGNAEDVLIFLSTSPASQELWFTLSVKAAFFTGMLRPVYTDGYFRDFRLLM